MPLFEYQCRGCGSRFEHLTRPDRPAVCPACQSVELQKQLSVFAAQSSTPAKSFRMRRRRRAAAAATRAGLDPARRTRRPLVAQALGLPSRRAPYRAFALTVSLIALDPTLAERVKGSYVLLLHQRQGRIGEPVAPRNFSGIADEGELAMAGRRELLEVQVLDDVDALRHSRWTWPKSVMSVSGSRSSATSHAMLSAPTATTPCSAAQSVPDFATPAASR